MKRFLNRFDPRYLKVCLYASVTVLLTLAVGMVLVFSSGFFKKLWLLICAVLEPTVYGALIAYLLNPWVVKVSHGLKRMGWQRDKGKLRRIVGMIICIVGLVLIVAGILLVMVLVVTRSIGGMNTQTIQQLFNDAQGDLGRLITKIQGLTAEFGGVSEGDADLGARVTSLFYGVKNMLSTMVFSIIFSIYMLMDGDRVGGYCLRVLRATVGERATDRVMALLDDADRVFSGYLRGQVTDAVVVGVLASVVLSLAGVPFGPVIGLLTGLGNLIPYVGAPLGIATTILVCLVDSQFDKMIVGIVCLALIMFIDSNVINPKLLSDNIEVHPLLVVGALIAGGAVGGLAGMLVAVPAAAFLKIQLDRWLQSREMEEVALQLPEEDEEQ